MKWCRGEDTFRMSSGQASVFYTEPRIKDKLLRPEEGERIDAIRKGGKKF